MIDTMKANNLDALSAILIGIQYNIIVVKDGENFTPYINGRLIKHSGKSTQTERSIYYEGISVDVERYENITLLYEDPTGDARSLDLEGDKARLFQHHLDYCFGSTFVDRVDKEMKQRINDHLEFGLVKDGRGEGCPTTLIFYRDYFKKFAKYLMLIIVATFATPLFVSMHTLEIISIADRYLLALSFVSIICYFFYAQYESKKYKQCTSCQTGHTVGVSILLLAQLLLIGICLFWWL